MPDIDIRKEGRAGRITLTRPQALNAITYDMCLAIDAALTTWRDDDDVALVLIDAEGTRAFSAGGDIAEMYTTGRAGDYAYGRRFWHDEYRMNARLAGYTKPVVSFLQGFTMGGGVGVGCHGSHRIVGESAQIAMPECGIGLVPDVGGSFLLALAPGRIGEYLGTTGARMGPADAILAGFADLYIPEDRWEALKTRLVESGDASVILAATSEPPTGRLVALRPEIDTLFAGRTASEIRKTLRSANSPFASETLTAFDRAAPLSAAVCVEMLHRLRKTPDMQRALELEYRFTYRAMAHADFIEGIRAAIIDKDRKPRWRHTNAERVGETEVAQMLAPLGMRTLRFDEAA